MTFRYRGFRVVIGDGDNQGRPTASYLFDPMTPGAQCVATESDTPTAAAQLVCRYIDEQCEREGLEVLEQLATQ